MVTAGALIPIHPLVFTPYNFPQESTTTEIAEPLTQKEILALIDGAFPREKRVMRKIAKCESGISQFSATSTVLRSRTADYGIFQINGMHRKKAETLGLDIMTEEGNVLFAKYLYKTRGLNPWTASFSCWRYLSDDG